MPARLYLCLSLCLSVLVGVRACGCSYGCFLTRLDQVDVGGEQWPDVVKYFRGHSFKLNHRSNPFPPILTPPPPPSPDIPPYTLSSMTIMGVFCKGCSILGGGDYVPSLSSC